MELLFSSLEHEGPLTAVNITSDGLYVLAGTNTVSSRTSAVNLTSMFVRRCG